MRSGRSRNDRRSSPASPSGHRSALIPDVWEWPQLHRNAGRQKTCFYINRERPTSALGAGPRAQDWPSRAAPEARHVRASTSGFCWSSSRPGSLGDTPPQMRTVGCHSLDQSCLATRSLGNSVMKGCYAISSPRTRAITTRLRHRRHRVLHP